MTSFQRTIRTGERTSAPAVVLALAVFLALGGLPRGAGASGEDSRLASPPDASYRLGANDVLAISVWGHVELSGKFTIAGDGSLSLPLIGSITAIDRTVTEIQSDLVNRLADGYLKNPRVAVAVEHYVSQRVYVIGEVRNPGAVSLTGPITLLEALARAGALTEQAGGELQIVRADSGQPFEGPLAPGQPGTSEIARLSVQRLRRGTLPSNIPLRNGDTVFVPRAEDFFVLGLVNNPGTYTIETGLNVMRALSMAGGTTPLGSTGRIKIIRIVEGKKTEIKATLDDLLQPGDTVMVGARRF